VIGQEDAVKSRLATAEAKHRYRKYRLGFAVVSIRRKMAKCYY
jgi:hypothetical protein